MPISPGTEKHKELNTSYTKFDQLHQDISENRFSGYIWRLRKIVFIEVISDLQKIGPKKRDKKGTSESCGICF